MDGWGDVGYGAKKASEIGMMVECVCLRAQLEEQWIFAVKKNELCSCNGKPKFKMCSTPAGEKNDDEIGLSHSI